jgi:hypothetical protein
MKAAGPLRAACRRTIDPLSALARRSVNAMIRRLPFNGRAAGGHVEKHAHCLDGIGRNCAGDDAWGRCCGSACDRCAAISAIEIMATNLHHLTGGTWLYTSDVQAYRGTGYRVAPYVAANQMRIRAWGSDGGIVPRAGAEIDPEKALARRTGNGIRPKLGSDKIAARQGIEHHPGKRFFVHLSNVIISDGSIRRANTARPIFNHLMPPISIMTTLMDNKVAPWPISAARSARYQMIWACNLRRHRNDRWRL